MAHLVLDHITLTYEGAQGDLDALVDLDLAVAPGESVAIIGPSGCGKSSMLQLASGLVRPSAGTVTIDGSVVEKPRRSTALILQDFGLLPWKTALGNVALGLKVRGVPRAERSRRACSALDMVELGGFAGAYPGELSGGMRQRLAIARALALDVDLLLMDEPLSALDALLREQLQDLLLDLWREQGYAQVLVTHSIEEAVFLGSRIVVMAPRPGRVVAEVANPGMGARSYRTAPEFYQVCTAVRNALRQGTRGTTGCEGCACHDDTGDDPTRASGCGCAADADELMLEAAHA